MIGFLRGKVAFLYTDYCLLDVGGVGYRVYVTGSTWSRLRQGSEAMLFTHLSVREDAMQLFGFYSKEEYDLFQLLITVSGIGPKVAQGVLGATTPDKLCLAIKNKQTTALTKLPGIGKKSAERLILELKDKVSISPSEDTGSNEGLFADIAPADEDAMSEAAAALQALGYSPQEYEGVLRRFKSDLSKGKAADTQTVIKFALKEMMKR